MGGFGGPQDVAARRDFAQDVDERGRKGAKLGKQTERSRVGRGPIWRDRPERIATETFLSPLWRSTQTKRT